MIRGYYDMWIRREGCSILAEDGLLDGEQRRCRSIGRGGNSNIFDVVKESDKVSETH